MGLWGRFVTLGLAPALTMAAAERAPDFVIGSDADPYLLRWWLIPRNPLFNAYLHVILRSDDDRALHDHPWPNVSVVLSGCYIEHTIAAGGVSRRRVIEAGGVRLRSPWAAHRLEIVAGPAVTLFLTGPKLRSWGFHCPQGWVHWRRFTDPADSGKVGPGCGT